MNTKLLNTINLDDGKVIIKKGSGGGGDIINNQYKYIELTENGTTLITPDSGFTGLSEVEIDVAIPNEEKTIEITENGTTEVTADNGFLSKVIVNTNVASSGGVAPDMPVIGDGKTYLYIKIVEGDKMNVPLYFSQTVSNGVTIDWGDGSTTETVSGTGNLYTSHTYNEIGEYTISLNPIDGKLSALGNSNSSYSVLGGSHNTCKKLKAVEIGVGVTSISNYAFYRCPSLTNVVIPDSVTSIGGYAFYWCHSLESVVIPDSVTSIGGYAFTECQSLSRVVIPDGVKTIGERAFDSCYALISVVILGSVTTINNYAFYNCTEVLFFDFSYQKSVPNLRNSDVFKNIPSDCKIVVPDALYDTWIAATNWSTHASKIIKASEFNG